MTNLKGVTVASKLREAQEAGQEKARLEIQGKHRMNEQFKKLLLEAQALARAEVKSSPEFAKYAPSYAIPGTEIHVGLGLSYQKFAELIVREAADFVSGAAEVYNQAEQDACVRASVGLKKYFGVEE